MDILVYADKKTGELLEKKISFFNSGMVPLERYERDMHLIDRLKPYSLRVDLYMGDRSMEFGDLVDGSMDKISYHFEKFDRFIKMLRAHNIVPYISWCYIPLPLQPADGDYRSYPIDESGYYEIIKRLSSHLKELMEDEPYYEEVYNEADCNDVFFTGTFEQYLRLYELGTRAIRDAGSTAMTGGPAEAFVLEPEKVRDNLRSFLENARKKALPLDFLSFHTYGYENGEYTARTRAVLELLKEYGTGNEIEVHINEINVVPAPWEIGKTILDDARILPLIFNLIDEYSKIPDVSMLHWAQLLESGIDALGVVDVNGGIKPAFFAFEIFGRMPLPRLWTTQEGPIRNLVSMDENRFSAVFWNAGSDREDLSVKIRNLPESFKTVDVFVLNRKFWERLKTQRQCPLEAAVERSVAVTDEINVSLEADEIIYLESNTEK